MLIITSSIAIGVLVIVLAVVLSLKFPTQPKQVNNLNLISSSY